MLVTNDNYEKVLNDLGNLCSLDCETTGFYYFKNDELFSVIISDEKDNYYFNFKPYVGESAPFFQRGRLSQLKPILENPNNFWFLQNAKFDMHMLAREGLFIAGKIYDLMVMDRLIYNQHLRYNLDEMAKRRGFEKLDIVDNYVKEHKLISTYRVPGLSKEGECKHYDQVPFHIMQPYGEMDGEITRKMGKQMLIELLTMDTETADNIPKLMSVLENECALTKVLFDMEHHGCLIDRKYCQEALGFYHEIVNRSVTKFKELTGFEFVKGTTVFEQVFESEKNIWLKTETGEWCWDSNQMERLKNPAARLVLDYAEAKKQLEYFENFLFFIDSSDVVHPNFNQAGTVTSRLSASNPNFQNLSNPDKYDDEAEASKYPVRAAIIPRPGTFLLSVDYSQVEFRVFLDYAKAYRLIAEIDKGLDVHQATANIAGISRKEAKTTNFLTLYGGGVAKLCMNLYKTRGSQLQISTIYKDHYGWTMTDEEIAILPDIPKELYDFNLPLIQKAWKVREAIFKAAPELKKTMRAITEKAEKEGYVRDWLGRRYYFSDKKWSYKAPNHLIQGGSAQIIKVAMVRIFDYLKDKKTRMILSIHDELIFEVPFDETFVVEEIKLIMQNAYPYKAMKLATDAEFSFDNLADKRPWSLDNFKSEQARRNQV